MIEYTVKVLENGDKEWYLNGELHREDGPAVEYSDGDKEWYLNGKFHREDGPAFEGSNGDKFWCLNGKSHREDGPAVEYVNGSKYWYLNGEELTEKQHKKATRKHKEYTVAELEEKLGEKIKIVKG